MQTIPDKLERPDSTRIIPAQCTSHSEQRRNSSYSATHPSIISSGDPTEYHADDPCLYPTLDHSMSSMGSTHYLQQPQQARHSVPRSPSLHSLSNFITPNNTIHDNDEKRDSNSIVHVPLNTGDEEEDYDPSDVPMYYVGGMSSRTLVAPPVRRASWRATTGTCNTDSKYSILSAPSKICSSSTHQYIFTPPSMISLPHTDKQSRFTPVLATTKKPSRRGVCNTMTILAVVLVVLFLFAGYPITLRIAKHLKDDDA